MNEMDSPFDVENHQISVVTVNEREGARNGRCATQVEVDWDEDRLSLEGHTQPCSPRHIGHQTWIDSRPTPTVEGWEARVRSPRTREW